MNKQSLQDLRDKVAAGDLDNVPRRMLWVDFDIEGEGYQYRVNVNAAAAYHGSIDAAVAFLEAVLPEWGWRLQDMKVGTGAVALVVKDNTVSPECRSDTPARALLLATLDALIEGAE